MAVSTGERRRRAKLAAVVFAGALLPAVVLEHWLLSLTPIHDGLEEVAYDVMERLLSVRPHRDPDVTVIDITDIDREPAPEAWTRLNRTPPPRTPVVSRAQLRATLSKLPDTCRAVGIDVDFSCEDGQLITGGPQTVLPDDPDFFAFCAKQRMTADRRVFLGVLRRAMARNDAVFGDARFAALGALISQPREGWELGTLRAETLDGAVTRESMGQRLAAMMRAPGSNIPSWFAGEEAERRGDLLVTRGYIDYHWIPTLYAQRLTMAQVLNGTLPTTKLVLIGFGERDKSDKGDVISVPTYGIYPGIYAHAALAQTLLQGPLVGVRLWPSMFLTFLAELAVGLTVLRARLRYLNAVPEDAGDDEIEREERIKVDRARTRTEKAVAWMIVLVAFVLAPYLRIIWLGALAAMVNLLLFSFAGQTSETITERWEHFMHHRHHEKGEPS